MIKINLLPTEGAGQSKIYVELVAALVIIAIAAAGIGMYWNYLNSVIQNRKDEIVQKKKQVEKLQHIIDSVKKFEKEKRILQKKLDIIKNLKEKQLGPVTLLDTLSKSVPDNVWYSNLKQTGNNLLLKGAALSMMSIGDLINSLSDKNSLFQKVQLKKVRMVRIRNREIYRFTLKMNYKGDKKPKNKNPENQGTS